MSVFFSVEHRTTRLLLNKTGDISRSIFFFYYGPMATVNCV